MNFPNISERELVRGNSGLVNVLKFSDLSS